MSVFSGRVLTAGAMTGVAVLTTSPILNSTGRGISFQPIWTGTPTGAWAVQVSNDYGIDGAAGTWADLTVTGLSALNPAGAQPAAGTIIEVDTFARCVRLKYTNASSTGTLNVWAGGS